MRLASMSRTASLQRMELIINMLYKKSRKMNRWRATEATEEVIVGARALAICEGQDFVCEKG